MRHGRHAKRLAQVGSLLGIGFQAFFPPAQAMAGSFLDRVRSPAAQPALLAPRTPVAWSIDSMSGVDNTHIMAGKGIIGPDGTLVLGPYGSARVAGLTPLQAESAIERQLSAYVASPRVRLTIDRPGQPSDAGSKPTAASWQSMGTANPPMMASPPAPAAAQAAVSATVAVDPQQTAQLGVPAPSNEAGPAVAEWRPVQRSAPGADAEPGTSAWRPVPRPGQTTVGVVATGFEAPMPVGPAHDGIAQPTAVSADPKADELKMPRPVPDPSGGLVIGDGLAPSCAPGEGPGPGGPAPRECAKVSLPAYVVEPPDILIVASTQQLRDQSISGQHLVRPDGTLSLGIYGTVHVAGLTLEQTKEAIVRLLDPRIKDFDRKNLYVDVLAYNSKFYYVITDGGGYGEQVVRLPITGSETVLDAISQIYGLPPVASKKDIWVARSFPCQGGHGSEQVLPVDWCGITQRGQTQTNYQIMPGDRVYVKAQRIIRADSIIAKVLSPVERILGVTLLGSSTVNSIKNRSGSGSGQ